MHEIDIPIFIVTKKIFKQKEIPFKIGQQRKRGSYVQLLPDIIGIRERSQAEQPDILTQGGQIQSTDLWTTESLVDKLTSHIIQVKEDNKQPNSTGSSSYDRNY